MLITFCHIANTSDTPRVLTHRVFLDAPYVACFPGGIVQCRSGRLEMEPGVVYRVPVIVWCEAGQRQPWCVRYPDDRVDAMFEAAKAAAQAPQIAPPAGEKQPEGEPAAGEKSGQARARGEK